MKRNRFDTNDRQRIAIIHAWKDMWPEQIIGMLREADVRLKLVRLQRLALGDIAATGYEFVVPQFAADH